MDPFHSRPDHKKDDDDHNDDHDSIPGVGPGSIVDKSVLEESEKDEGDANVVPHIDCLAHLVLICQKAHIHINCLTDTFYFI